MDKNKLQNQGSISKCADITAKQQQREREAFVKIRSEFTETTDERLMFNAIDKPTNFIYKP